MPGDIGSRWRVSGRGVRTHTIRGGTALRRSTRARCAVNVTARFLLPRGLAFRCGFRLNGSIDWRGLAAQNKESRPDRTRATRWFLHDAFTDYVAARTLLLADLPKQASILSSTAIEKCVKAVLAFRGNASWGHLNVAHWNVLKSDSKCGHLLNRDFVELNERAYSLRYTDKLPVGFNLVIASREFLAEMDHTVLTILSCFKIDEGSRRRLTGYEIAIRKGDERLIAENHLIARVPLEEFIYAKAQFVYEARLDPLRGLLEAYYTTSARPRRPGFLRAGLSSSGGNAERFETSHSPLSNLSLLREGGEQVGGIRS